MRPDNRHALIGVAQRLSDKLPARWGRRARDLGKIALDHRGQRRTAFRQVQYEFARRASPVLAAPFGPGQLLVDAHDDEIGRTVFISGGYERWHMEAAVAHLRAVGRDPAGLAFLDVGANIGTSTIDALVQFGFGRAVCFEPAVDNARLLRVNLVWNDVQDRTVVHAVAVSDRNGAGSLTRSADNSGDHRFTAGTNGSGGGGSGSGGSAPCRTLDSFVASGDIDPPAVGLLWIDAQGHEPHVLRGATSLLEAGVPVVAEYCPWVLGAAVDDLNALIARHFGTIVNLNVAADGGGEDMFLDADDLPELARRFATRGYADLLLISDT